MQKNWNVTGPVTVKTHNGESWTYGSLIEAVRDWGERNISLLEYGVLGSYGEYFYDLTWKNRHYIGHRWNGLYLKSDPIIFVDELGFTIPVWKVKEVWASHGIPRREHYGRYWYGFKRNPSRGKNKRTFRNLHHWEEVEDEDLSEAQVNSLNTHRAPNPVLAMWDDCELRGQRTKSWKVYRHQQNKKVGEDALSR